MRLLDKMKMSDLVQLLNTSEKFVKELQVELARRRMQEPHTKVTMNKQAKKAIRSANHERNDRPKKKGKRARSKALRRARKVPVDE